MQPAQLTTTATEVAKRTRDLPADSPLSTCGMTAYSLVEENKISKDWTSKMAHVKNLMKILINTENMSKFFFQPAEGCRNRKKENDWHLLGSFTIW